MSVHAHEEAFTETALVSPGFTLADSLEQRPLSEDHPHRSREAIMRRLLVVTDVLALTLAFIVIEIVGGFHSGHTRSVLRDLALLAFGIPVWVAAGPRPQPLPRRQPARRPRLDRRGGPDHPDGDPVELERSCSGSRRPGSGHVTIPKLALFWGADDRSAPAAALGRTRMARRQSWYVQSALIVGPPVQTATVARRMLRHPEYRDQRRRLRRHGTRADGRPRAPSGCSRG